MRKFLLFIVVVLLSVGVSAQSGFGGNNPLPEYQSQKDINYVGDGHVGHRLDIYYPKDEQPKHPVIIHIYGSAWSQNNFKNYADLATVGVAALEAGYIFVTPNYRSSSDAKFSAQLQDIKAVVRYLRGNAQTLGVDTSFIAVSGFSSGGHLAALMGVTRGLTEKTVGLETIDIEGNLGNHTDQSSSVDAVCSWSGMVEIRDQTGCDINTTVVPFIEDLIGNTYASKPDKWALASANTYVGAKNAPTVIFHGSADAVYPQCVSENFYNNLTAAGVECEYYSHTGDHSVNADYTDEMITFFDRIKAAKANTGIEDIRVDVNGTQKVMVDGAMYIIRDGKAFNALGTQVK